MTDLTPDEVDAEFAERSRLRTLDRVASCLAMGIHDFQSRDPHMPDIWPMALVADPEEPDDDDPLAIREFYIDTTELTYLPGTGGVTGTHPVRYRLVLERVEEPA